MDGPPKHIPKNSRPEEYRGTSRAGSVAKIFPKKGNIQGGPLPVKKWSYNPYKWAYRWVTGVITLLITAGAHLVSSMRHFREKHLVHMLERNGQNMTAGTALAMTA